MTVQDTEDKTLNTEIKEEETQPVEVYAEKADIPAPELDDAQIKAAALAYARYLKENNLSPGDPTFIFVDPEKAGDMFKAPEAAPQESAEEPESDAEEVTEEAEEAKEAEAPDSKAEESKSEEDPQKTEAQKKRLAREKARKKDQKQFLAGGKKNGLASVADFHDKAQDGIDNAITAVGKDVVRGAHSIASTYQHSRKGIGIAILITGLLAAVLLIVFDMFTVYEYAYNGKVLGYVHEQEVVTDVLDVAARNLSKNNNDAGVSFVANQNITFNLVDGRGKSTDDSDTVVNKLIYMTDIETEAYAVYDGNKVVAVVKSENDAEELLKQTQAELSTPDRGMSLVSSRFVNDLSVRPVNVLLGSIQSNNVAKALMINCGDMNTYHIAEAGETAETLAQEFGVEVTDIYNENNSEIAEEIEQGDRVCIRSTTEPVSVEMFEGGSLKEVIRYETIKEETDEYYKGDAVLKQEGQDGMEVFYGTITKVGGVETKRKASKEAEVLQEKVDKIILVGTAKRPKTAATGTFIMPIKSYVVTSEWGGRWGRMHEGMDFGAPTGTPVYASDGGKVIKANFWSGHGLCVEIDHGNGVITRYSHLSATHVSIGDLVYQGQHIANVGNTGHSFGSHLHFEVRVNGSSQNPRNYVNP